MTSDALLRPGRIDRRAEFGRPTKGMVRRLFCWLFRGGVGNEDEVAAAAEEFCLVWPMPTNKSRETDQDHHHQSGTAWLELGFPELRGYLSRFLGAARHPIEAADPL